MHYDIAPDFRQLYEQRINEYGDSFRANGHSPYAFRLRRKLYNYVLGQKLPSEARSRPVTILDSGCGNGTMSPAFRKHLQIIRLVGIDYVAEACRIAERIYYYDQTVLGNVLDLPSKISERFDVVNSCEVFLYIPPEQRLAFWQSHAAMLKPGGWMILLIPNIQCFFRKIKPVSNAWGYSFNLDTVLADIQAFPWLRVLSISGISMITGRTFDLPVDGQATLKRITAFEIALVLEHDSTC